MLPVCRIILGVLSPPEPLPRWTSLLTDRATDRDKERNILTSAVTQPVGFFHTTTASILQLIVLVSV